LVEVERQEKRYLYALIIVAVLINVVTISPIIPWQGWLFWSKPEPTSTFNITICDYKFTLPAGGIIVKVGQPVKFVVKGYGTESIGEEQQRQPDASKGGCDLIDAHNPLEQSSSRACLAASR
jgi:hypothetical protein